MLLPGLSAVGHFIIASFGSVCWKYILLDTGVMIKCIHGWYVSTYRFFPLVISFEGETSRWVASWRGNQNWKCFELHWRRSQPCHCHIGMYSWLISCEVATSFAIFFMFQFVRISYCHINNYLVLDLNWVAQLLRILSHNTVSTLSKDISY